MPAQSPFHASIPLPAPRLIRATALVVAAGLSLAFLVAGCPRGTPEDTAAADQQQSEQTAPPAGSVVDPNAIPDNSIDGDKLENDAVTTEKLADGTIIAGDLSADAVTTEKIKDGAVGPAGSTAWA